MYARVTLTGTFTLVDGSPASGSVTITPSVRSITDVDDVILTGPVRLTLDDQGKFSVDLPATDDPNLTPAGFTYSVTVAMHHAYWSTTGLSLPASAGTVDLASVPASEVVVYETVTGAQAKADAAEAAAIAAASADLDAHEATTTAVHGIPDTAALETQDGAQARVDAHTADTTAHPATAVTVTPTGGVAATTVQAAIAELDAEKETPAGAQARVDAHSADTTSVHGIPDTSVLETQSGAQAKADAAEAAATAYTDTEINAHRTEAGAHQATAVTVEVRRNLVPNPSFETNAADFYISAALVERDSAWSASGGWSGKITANSTSTDSFISPGGDRGAIRLGMQPGKTYTASGTIRLAAPQTGTLRIQARQIAFFYKQGTNYISAVSETPPNEAGEYRLSVTVTLPSDATEAFVLVYNGAASSGGSVWCDALMVEESAVVGDYFDGSYSPDPDLTPEWTGAVDNSASRLVQPAQATLADLIARVTALETTP